MQPETTAPGISPAAPAAGGRGAELKRLWKERKRYQRSSDWMWSLYSRLLNSRLGRKLPLRGRVRAVRLAGMQCPVHVRLGTTDWLVLKELFFDGGYDAVFRELPGIRRIVDLGSNIGLSLRLWQLHYPEARGIGVEPDPGNFEICRRNAGMGTRGRFEVIQACAAAKERTVYLDRTLGEWGITMHDEPVPGAQAVPAMTMPQLLERLGGSDAIDLLKCDIEGAERELFADCRTWIGRVRNLLVELHAPYTREQFLHDVENSGGRFTARQLDEGEVYSQLLLVGR